MANSTPVTWTFEEVDKGGQTADTLLTATRTEIGGQVTGADLTGAVTELAPGLSVLVIQAGGTGPFPAKVEELKGAPNPDDKVFVDIDKAALAPSTATPGEAIAGFRFDTATGPVLVIPLG